MSIEKIIYHLEFLGYEAEEDDDGDWLLTSTEVPRKLLIRKGAGGVNFSLSFGLESLDFDLEALNKFNSQLWLSKATFVNDELVGFDAWMPNYYEKTVFGQFFERFKQEANQFVEVLVDALPEED